MLSCAEKISSFDTPLVITHLSVNSIAQIAAIIAKIERAPENLATPDASSNPIIITTKFPSILTFSSMPSTSRLVSACKAFAIIHTLAAIATIESAETLSLPGMELVNLLRMATTAIIAASIAAKAIAAGFHLVQSTLLVSNTNESESMRIAAANERSTVARALICFFKASISSTFMFFGTVVKSLTINPNTAIKAIIAANAL